MINYTTKQIITITTIQLYNYRAIQRNNYIKMENNKITTCYTWGAIHQIERWTKGP